MFLISLFFSSHIYLYNLWIQSMKEFLLLLLLLLFQSRTFFLWVKNELILYLMKICFMNAFFLSSYLFVFLFRPSYIYMFSEKSERNFYRYIKCLFCFLRQWLLLSFFFLLYIALKKITNQYSNSLPFLGIDYINIYIQNGYAFE
jgi:hypothetical protein